MIKPENVVEDSKNVLINNTNLETGAKPDAGSGAKTGSEEHTSDLFKYETKLNPI